MATLAGRVRPTPEQTDHSAFQVDAALPSFSYERMPDESMTRVLGPVTNRRVPVAVYGDFGVELPDEFVLGREPQAFAEWARQAGLRGLSFPVEVAVTEGGAAVLRQTLEVLYFAGGPRMVTHGARGQFPPLFLLNAQLLWQLLDEVGGLPDQNGEFAVLEVLARLGDLVDGRLVRREVDQDRLAMLAERSGLGIEIVNALYKQLNQLGSFEIPVPERTPVRLAGTFAIADQRKMDASRFAFFHPVVEIPVHTITGTTLRTFTPRWPAYSGTIDLPVNFEWQPKPPISRAAAAGPVSVRVSGFDGSVLWREAHPAGDPNLETLDIVVPKYLPMPVASDTTSAEDVSLRRLRGQVVAMDPAQTVASLTVVVQARLADEPHWRLVSSGTTDGAGYFTLPYPPGAFVAAQALVSIAPDSTTDIALTQPAEDGSTLARDFLYLVVAAGATTPEDGCGCGGKHVSRLPDQADLIRSGEYTQDLGGGCISITTPNRTLREYDFTAIVRATDPDVSGYTLTRRTSGEFVLDGGSAKIDRRSVDLDNPIRWQDSPATGDSLTFYQAVTVACGHVLHFKAAFKADGYSLGDLVYSLPLAPGQKKQVVAYDMANTLEASESQRVRQSERLAAGLIDDRTITDELSGALSEELGGRSRAHTSGMSAGLGAAGSIGAIGGSLGVAGGFSNSSSSASQSGSRGIAQYFGERLRQTLTQNAEAYRELNASVVTTVRDGQEYSVETEVVANHNHCHSITMMYFEVLRHYAIVQQLTDVSECIFVPLLLTEFTPKKITRWKDVLSANLLPLRSATYLQPSLSHLSRRPTHPLLKAFDAMERVETNWTRVDYPTGTYAEDAITSIGGEFRLRTRLPRPLTRFDRISSLPLTTETRTSEQVNYVKTGAAAAFTGGLSLLFGPSTDTVEQTLIVREKIFDAFMELDANYQTVRPANCIRVKTFRDQTIVAPGMTPVVIRFFQNTADRDQWAAYAKLLGIASPEDLLEEYFVGKLISEWDQIYNRDLAPRIFNAILDTIKVSSLNLDMTAMNSYTGGERSMQIRVSGGAHAARDTLPSTLRLHSNSVDVHSLRSFTTLIVENVALRYQTAHYSGVLHQGFAGGDLLDGTFATSGVQLNTPLTSQDKRNPRKEDEYLAEELVTHLNANLEHYNTALWHGLDKYRRFMLLDGFSIQTYNDAGLPVGTRSLASVVKHQLLDIAGNALVFPVADGYRVSQSLIVESGKPVPTGALREQYQPDVEVPPYRLSVPTRGVYMEAVMGQCDSCEMVKPNSSQDWDRFRTDEPTAINEVTVPTPQRVDWRVAWAQFASPLVAMQIAREAPPPGAGLAGLSDALTKGDSFRDVTGLAANQANAMQTFLSNQENAKAFASMAKTMAMQQHNSENSGDIMRTLEQARSSGAVDDNTYRELVRDHLGQQIDGGTRRSAEDRAEEVRQPSLTNAAINAVGDGRGVTAHATRPDGTRESVEVAPGGQSAFRPIHYEVPLIPQPNKTSCWAASMAMIESYRRSHERQQTVVVTAAELADQVGYSLEQSYGWDRLESVKDFFDFDEIRLTGTQFPTAQQWRSWLAAYGPLYVTVAGAPSHAIIVHGISGDGTAEGSRLDLLDPWDVNTSFDSDPTQFNPPNQGARLNPTVTELNARLNAGDLDTLALYEDWRILYQPANSPAALGVPPSGAGTTRVLRVRTLNRLLETDNAIAARFRVLSPTFNLEQPLRGTGWHDIATAIPDGSYELVVSPDQVALEPADWTAFARPTGTSAQPDRIWTEEQATITIGQGRVTAITGNPHITLSGESVTVRLRPLWAHTPHARARTTDPTVVVVHHTGGTSPLPEHFVHAVPGTQPSAAHYVISQDGAIVKLADERTESAYHAGRSRWRGHTSVNDVSVGIELVHTSGNYPAVQVQALNSLLGQLRAAFAGIELRNVIGHSDCGITDTSSVLGRKLTDPGRALDWPGIEVAGHSLAPASEALTFPGATDAEDIYHGYFKTNRSRRMTKRASTTVPLPAAVADAHKELKADLTTIGYYIPAIDVNSDEYTDSTARAVACFMDRFFAGSRTRPDADYAWNTDFDTAKMVKRVLRAVTP